MLAALLSFTVAAVLLVILPGPDSLVVIRGLTKDGRSGGIRTSLGVVCGLLVWVFAAVLGLSALLQASEIGFEVLKIVGGVYLVWMGVQTLRSMRAMPTAPTPSPGRAGGFVAGFLTDILNPKIGILFITLLPGFVPDGYSTAWTTLGFGMLYVALTCVYFAAIVLAAGRIANWMQTPRIRRRIDAVAGIALIGFGVRLATE